MATLLVEKKIVTFIHRVRNGKTKASLQITVAHNNQAKNRSFIRELPTKSGISYFAYQVYNVAYPTSWS